MTPDMKAFGVYRLETVLASPTEEFQIVRDRDWEQVFHPQNYASDFQSRNPVLGPHNDAHDLNWMFEGSIGDVIEIEFRRNYTSCRDEMQITWRTVRNMTAEELGLAVKKRSEPLPETHVLGTRRAAEGEE